jgi:hypothetical protein
MLPYPSDLAPPFSPRNIGSFHPDEWEIWQHAFIYLAYRFKLPYYLRETAYPLLFSRMSCTIEVGPTKIVIKVDPHAELGVVTILAVIIMEPVGIKFITRASIIHWNKSFDNGAGCPLWNSLASQGFFLNPCCPGWHAAVNPEIPISAYEAYPHLEWVNKRVSLMKEQMRLHHKQLQEVLTRQQLLARLTYATDESIDERVLAIVYARMEAEEKIENCTKLLEVELQKVNKLRKALGYDAAVLETPSDVLGYLMKEKNDSYGTNDS